MANLPRSRLSAGADHRVFGFNFADVLWLISGIALVGIVTLAIA
jgi:hypothetical protein